MPIKIKICCIASEEEARIAIDAGADALGLVSSMPSGPGVIDDDLIQHIAALVPPPIHTFLLTSRRDSSSVIEHQQQVRTSTIQLVDSLEKGSHHEIRQALPGIKIVQVIHVVGEESIDEALEAAETADAVLLDSGNPTKAIKELGGTGRTHNWNVSRKIVEQSVSPVFLAGGLNTSNAKEAIDKVQPFGLDICSGVRTRGLLDPQKLAAFIKAVRT